MEQRELILKFIFKVDRNREQQQEDLDNNTLYELRRGVAHTLAHSEFGEVEEWGNDGFENRWAVPAIDAYIPHTNELHIAYLFLYPLAGRGNLMSLITRNIFELHELARQLNTTLNFSMSIV